MLDTLSDKANKFVIDHNIRIAEFRTQPFLSDGIFFQNTDKGWSILLYPKFRGTNEGDTLVLFALSSIYRRESNWLKLPEKEILLEISKRDSTKTLINQILVRFCSVFEINYLIKNDYLSLEELRNYTSYVFMNMVDYSDAVESLACIAVIRANGGDVIWIQEEIIKIKRYEFLKVIDIFESIFPQNAFSEHDLISVAKLLYDNGDTDKSILDLQLAGKKTFGPRTRGHFDYHYAISFAGEDRGVAEEIAISLKKIGIDIFYDKYEQSNLWGKDLYSHLSDVYSKRAKYCIMIISEHYAKKQWTTHERKAAQCRAFSENIEYILPIRLDDTAIPGLLDTVGYVDMRIHQINEVVDMLIEKVSNV
jgi:hypothetical protein